MYEIWSEGHAAQGSPMGAQLIATIAADSFDEAVQTWVETEYSRSQWGQVEHINGRWFLWGCELFDNEYDARRNYG